MRSVIINCRITKKSFHSLFMGKPRSQTLNLRPKPVHDNSACIANLANMFEEYAESCAFLIHISEQDSIGLHFAPDDVDTPNRRADRCDLSDQWTWEYVQIVPRLRNFWRFDELEILGFNALALIEFETGMRLFHASHARRSAVLRASAACSAAARIEAP
jgi:hypothetical protein